ncbi:MAG: septum formation protein Maf [Clostridia bacterium]|nr:septum formation protein Maf [Clostridia bacterium]
MNYEYILASASPRRKELLKEILPEFTISPSKANESVSGDPSPKKLVQILAERKAREISALPENEGKIVLGSDTVVALGDKILGKPADEAEAKRMLQSLSGNKHFVWTGVCFARTQKGATKTLVSAVKTAVYFEKISEERIEEYIAGGSPMDKAGAYGIQDGGLVKKLKGSYSNVVGLPVEHCRKRIEKIEKKGL